MTEVWFRNPLTYIRECAELCVPNIVWDRGLLRKNRVDPTKHIELHYASAVPYRLLLVGDQGTAELRRGHTIANPFAVYPTWEYGEQTINELEKLVAEQHIERATHLPPDERGVKGQEHRVVIIRPPNAGTNLGIAFLEVLREMQFEYPNCIIHYHGTYSFRVAFGMGFGAADMDPVSFSSKGRVVLGSGRAMLWEDAEKYPSWVALSGFQHSQLRVARNRTMFVMRSAIWAGDHFNTEDKWRVRPVDSGLVDYESAVPVQLTVRDATATTSRHPAKAGDKFACDHCSIAPTCKHHRDGGVCIIPGSDTEGLARYFKTRDSDQIITGIGRLQELQLERVQRGIENERVDPEGDLDPELTKALKNAVETGVKLAKLVNPALAGGTKVGVFIGGGAAGAVGAGGDTQQALVASVVAELEASGVAREDIDANMVAQYLAGKNRKAIEATVVEP